MSIDVTSSKTPEQWLDEGLAYAKNAKQQVSRADLTMARNCFFQAISSMDGSESAQIEVKIKKLNRKIDRALSKLSNAVNHQWDEVLGTVPIPLQEPSARHLSDAHPELKEALEELQTRLDAKGYLFPITVDAPIPLSEHPVDPTKAKQWIKAHPEGVAREVAQTLIDHTTYVSFRRFETELKKSIASLNEDLQLHPEQPFVVVARKGKSNGWVTALAIPYLTRLPDQIIDLDDKSLQLTDGTRVVFFDDAIYSGSQIGVYVTEFKAAHPNTNITCHIVVPYITGFGEEEIRSRAEKVQLSVKIAAHSPMTSIFKELQDRPNIASAMQKMYFRLWDGSIFHNTMYYFDHKIADNLSTVPQAYEEGAVLDEKGYFINGPDGRPLAHRFIPGRVKEPYK